MKIAKLLLPLAVLIVSGCATTPKTPIDMSWYNTPSSGSAGVYFYQWKTGVLGSYSDVRFKLDGESIGQINTGEWLYMEVPAGEHEYRVSGGFLPVNAPFNFEEGQNYFFRGAISMGTDIVIWVNEEDEIKETIKSIESNHYEYGDVD